MKATKTSVEAAIRALNNRIPVAVAIQQDIESLLLILSAEKKTIRALLEEAGVDRHPCAEGCEAVVVAEERMAWNVKDLQDLLDKEEFERLCPRRPLGEELKQLLGAHLTWERELRRCAKVSKSSRLELRAPAAEIVKHATRGASPVNRESAA